MSETAKTGTGRNMTLQDIKARADAATPGPWHSDRGGDFQAITLHSGSLWIAVVDGSHQKPPIGEWIDSPDIDFIENARTDVPKLVAALEAGLIALGSYTMPTPKEDPAGIVIDAMESHIIRVRSAIERELA